jgi:hypothetical protein
MAVWKSVEKTFLGPALPLTATHILDGEIFTRSRFHGYGGTPTHLAVLVNGSSGNRVGDNDP